MANSLLLLFGELGLLLAIAAQTNCDSALDMEREEILHVADEIFLFLLSVDHLNFLVPACTPFAFVLE